MADGIKVKVDEDPVNAQSGAWVVRVCEAEREYRSPKGMMGP